MTQRPVVKITVFMRQVFKNSQRIMANIGQFQIFMTNRQIQQVQMESIVKFPRIVVATDCLSYYDPVFT
jgi:hypothetical protein